MFKVAAVVGKFYPPHKGHHFCIQTASEQAERVLVLVCERSSELIPGELRAEWLREIHPNAEVYVAKDIGLPDDDSKGWAQFTKEFFGLVPDAVFTSESYGEPYAQALGCVHVEVDKGRKHFPVSGTMIRRDPFACWEYLHPLVRSYFTLRFAIVGAESTGKSTLAQALAEQFSTGWVPEYGRRYTEMKMQDVDRVEDIIWTEEDFVSIAQEQRRQEDLAAQEANHVLFCDTDAFATGIWHERYMKTRSIRTERIDCPSRISLYFLTDAATPFVQDGLRDGEQIRSWMDERFKQRMQAEGRRYVALSGDHQWRLRLAADQVKAMLTQPFDYARANAGWGYGLRLGGY